MVLASSTSEAAAAGADEAETAEDVAGAVAEMQADFPMSTLRQIDGILETEACPAIDIAAEPDAPAAFGFESTRDVVAGLVVVCFGGVESDGLWLTALRRNFHDD